MGRCYWLGGLALTAALLEFSGARAQTDICAQIDAMYPQPGRSGALGENVYRPLPELAPIRSAKGQPGTINMSIDVDNVSGTPKGKPGFLYVGNYQVTNIPAFHIIRGAGTTTVLRATQEDRPVFMPNQCLALPEWEYSGTQWALVQADTLDILMQSRLNFTTSSGVPIPVNGGVPCRASNLHIHGMLVSPYHPARAGTGPYGDYVLDVTQPRDARDFNSVVDDCGTYMQHDYHKGHGLTDFPLHYVDLIPGEPGVNSMASGQHPSGLFWYHPHPHGFSKFQLSGGTTGVLTVGALTDYACPPGDGSPGNCTISNANIRVMALKNTGIAPINGSPYYGMIGDTESTFCAPTGGTRDGECQGVETGINGGKWVFTVNGVEFPTIRTKLGKMEIWRIANTSSDMTFRLSIVREGAPTKALPFQVLAVDGVSVAQPYKHAITHTETVLMPAGRMDIAIPSPSEPGSYLLHNDVAQTGDSGSGDTWPQIELARVVWQDRAAGEAAPPPSEPLVVAGPQGATQQTPVPHSVDDNSLAPPGPCVFKTGDTRVVYYVHRFVTVFGQAGGTPSGIKPHVNEVFGLISGVRHADGTMDFWSNDGKILMHSIKAVWEYGLHDGDTAFPAFGHNDFGGVCTKKGNVEVWELQNWTGEEHNFHLHQSRFTIYPGGTFQGPLPSVKGQDAWIKATDKSVADLDQSTDPGFHDTLPVPRGQSFCGNDPNLPGCHGRATTQCPGSPEVPVCQRPGIVTLLLDFSRVEQVGTFVFHCHILEHEDGGMMAPIRVLCPSGDNSCTTQQIQSSICRTPDGG